MRDHLSRILFGTLLLGGAPLLMGFLCFPLTPPPSTGGPAPVATFAPTVSADVASTAPGAASDLIAALSFPEGSTLAIGVSVEVPNGWGVADDAAAVDGSIVGSIQGFMTVDDPAPLPPFTEFGCSTTVDFDPLDDPPSDIKLLEATTDTGVKVSGADTDVNGLPQVIEDLDSNGLPDGVDKYPAFLNTLLPGTHHARYFGHTEAAGLSDLYVNIVVTELAPGGPYRLVTIVNDPTSRPESATPRFCAPQSTTLTLQGTSSDNPSTGATEGGETLYQNPTSAGAYTFSAVLVSEFDVENDGASNGFDNCPFTANASQADSDQDYVGDACENDAVQDTDVDGDGIDNGYDNCIFTPNAAQADGDLDDLGDACDPNAGTPDGPNHILSCTDPVGIGQSDPGGASCVDGAPTPTPTPTPKDPNGDTDGDTISNGADPNDDNDACTDVQELNTTDPDGGGPFGPEHVGGLRNPHNPWDFYDTNHDKKVDLPNDILGVILRWTPNDPEAYDEAYDRGPTTGPYPWNMTAPDGTIDLPNDILGVILQWTHDCN